MARDESLGSDYRRRKIVNEDVNAAEAIIMEGSDGSIEETDYLTMKVAAAFLKKIQGRIQSDLLAKDLSGSNKGS